MNQMNVPLMHCVTLVTAGCFVLIYAFLVGEKSLASGIRFGALGGDRRLCRKYPLEADLLE
jgi:hypothetical protein